jgi:hypothetical protein
MSLSIRMARQAMEQGYGFDQDQGDPGLGSFLKGAASFIGRKLIPTIGKVLPVVGTALGIGAVAVGLLKKKKRPLLLGPGLPASPGQFPMPVLFGGGMEMDSLQPSPQLPFPMPGTGIQIRGPFGAGAAVGSFPQQVQQQGRPGQPTGQQMVATGCGVAVRNTHLNKSGYFTYQQGRAAKPITWVAPGTKCVANRRSNPLNPRALSRAVSRVMSAKRASKLIQRISVRSSCPTRRASSGKSCKAKR